jgi:hypothetical protein
MIKQSRRPLAASAGGFASLPPPPPRIRPVVDAGWDDEKEDDVTDVYAEGVTLVLKRDVSGDDETTRELPWPTLRRLPAPPPSAGAPRAGAPGGFDAISASLAAASLPLPDFAAALARDNEARMPAPKRPSSRLAAGLAAAAVLALIAFVRSPGEGTIVVDASDTRGAPVDHLDVLVDGKRTACNSMPCSVAGARGLHEIKVVAEGLEAPATQAVAVASGHPTAVHFIVSRLSESVVQASSQRAVKPESSASDDGVAREALAAPVDPKPIAPAPSVVAPTVHTPSVAPSPPAYAAPVAPTARASRAPAVGGTARDGYLNINSIPASTCFLDGRALGSTPRLSVEVSAGSHTVKFRAPGSPSTKTVVVNVGVGETRLAVARL